MAQPDNPRRQAALALPCRHKRCGAGPGVECNHAYRGHLHQVRWNDADRAIRERMKLIDWNRCYAGLKFEDDAQRREDFGPNGDATTPGFFQKKDGAK